MERIGLWSGLSELSIFGVYLKPKDEMKKILIAVLILVGSELKAQITLDSIVHPQIGIGYDFRSTKISPTETKWYFADTLTNTFNLYNLDFTPFLLNVAVPEPFKDTSNNLMQVGYITRTLFDCDESNIEFAYQAPLGGPKPFYVVRTDGTILFQVDSARGVYCLGGCGGMMDIIVPIKNTEEGAKLFLMKTSPPWGFPIYSLCGQLPVEVLDFTTHDDSFVSMYPNPSSDLLTFDINLPDNINEYELVILDSNAKEIERNKITSGKHLVDVKNFSQGTYFYHLYTKEKAYQSGKFILNK
jgi:hypothetical protein